MGYHSPELTGRDHADVGSVRVLKRGRCLLIRILMTVIFNRMTSNLEIKIRNMPLL
jgi:hypothetical protein